MLYWNKYNGHDSDICGKRKKFDNTIYTFDIETSSYLILDGKQIPACDYLKLSKDEQEDATKCSCMYIWQFSINDIVYYGRTWDELKLFLKKLNECVPEQKVVFVHNLAFEFQFMKSQFHFSEVMARKSHKTMTAQMRDYNILFKCSYIMSDCALQYLPDLYNLPVEKMVGDLDYDKIRTSETILTEKEMKYCEYDCLVVYHYILEELKTYEYVTKIPTTSTGKVRRKLQDIIRTDFKYKRLVNKAISIDPHVYNLLCQAFGGGYTHSCYTWTDMILHYIDSFDECSAYPYTLVSCRFPSSEFRKCKIKKVSDIIDNFAYILVVRFKNIKCKYNNNFISSSKCRNIEHARYDNGRVISADSLEMTITDVDFKFFLKTYTGQYEILESYYSIYRYLPKQIVSFILDCYEDKTKFKNVDGKEIEYTKAKRLFNAIYGMAVTNEIRDNVEYNDELEQWIEEELTNEEIIEKLERQKKKAFMNFAWGVWCTSWSRAHLLERLCDDGLDEYAVYMDTDSIKLRQGYDRKVFDEYNDSVIKRLKYVANQIGIPFERFKPKDKFGIEHPLGVFESETDDGNSFTYDSFITQGAKKYAFIKIMDYKKAVKKKKNIVEIIGDKAKVLEITLAGVPKSGAHALKSLEEFRDDFVFSHEVTNKNILMYVDNEQPFELTDYLGHTSMVTDKSGCCLLPTTYVLGKAEEYANLISDVSSNRAIYKE